MDWTYRAYMKDLDLQYVNCNLCGDNRAEKLFQMQVFTVVKCARCGLVYLNPRPRPEDMMKVYDSRDYYFSDGKQTDMFYGYPDYTKLQKHIYFVAEELIRPIRNMGPGKLLDVGCGMGFMLKRFQELGWESYGIDISSYATEYARSELGLNVSTGTVDKFNFPENFFDLVTVILTIEHMPEPRATLQKLYKLMKTGSIIIIATHDIDGLWPKMARSKWQHLFVPEHLFFFAKRTLKRLLEDTGFNIIKTTETATLASVTGDGDGLRAPIKFLHQKNLERVAAPLLRSYHAIARKLNLSDEVTIYAVKR